MPILDFELEHSYQHGEAEGIVLPVELRTLEVVRLQAHVDTGAAYCLFQSDYAELLGLTLKEGILKRFSTAGGDPIVAYGHGVAMTTLGVSVDSVVYFTDHSGFQRNVLGRHGWLRHFRCGLVHSESKLYLGRHSG